jgi:hypothetical protein
MSGGIDLDGGGENESWGNEEGDPPMPIGEQIHGQAE